MRRQGKPVLTSVPPGPDNPLGRYWIGLNRTGVGIHGTNAPGSIYKTTTHGCIRMHPDDIEELFHRVELETPVTIIYEPVLVARVDGQVFVEAHADVYGRSGDRRDALPLAEADSVAVKRILARREGIARPVTPGSR
jgi:L,D-transpeptidase ErfK/SrfK